MLFVKTFCKDSIFSLADYAEKANYFFTNLRNLQLA